MRKVAIIFVLAVFAPSLVLGWLALRSLRDQQFILERQQSVLYQGITDARAAEAQQFMAGLEQEFKEQINALLAERPAREIAASFDDRLRSQWRRAKVGFVVTTGGDILAPLPNGRKEAQAFREMNEKFLQNQAPVEVYANNYALPPNAADAGDRALPDSAQQQRLASAVSQTRAAQSAAPPQQQQAQLKVLRNTQPLKKAESAPRDSTDGELSRIAPAEAEFQELIGAAAEGTLARFIGSQLNILVWYRPPDQPRYIFGAQLDIDRIKQELAAVTRPLDSTLQRELCIALLDDTAKPVSLSHPGFQANWKRPFVATEIGETLPHWEVAAYLVNPGQLATSARAARMTITLLVALLIIAIGAGSWLIVRDLNRHLALARQKTDFVSNVSHELKTPLTSIRMFAELLAEERVADTAKRRSYLNIITAEAARLTRLINNVLDFARMDRGENKFSFRDCDINEMVRDTAESYRPHLESNGFSVRARLAAEPLIVRGDCDAIAQVIVNLLSNAEKYSGAAKEIDIEVCRSAQDSCAEVLVADRGIGVPKGAEQKIFEQFYRAHDSLSSGIQGSGLGLTLARQIARAHGGDVACEPRAGGGSCFTLRLPLKKAQSGAGANSERSS